MIDLDPITRPTARLVLAWVEKDEAALRMLIGDLDDDAMVAALHDLIAGWFAVMLIALRDQGMSSGAAPNELHKALRGHAGRDTT